MLDVLDVIAGLALALVVVSLALAWAIRTAWRLMCNLRDEETEHAHTRRRLDDVEHLRRADDADELRALRDALTRHHQWHAAQTTPDPEHGFIPADEYAESALYQETVEALSMGGTVNLHGCTSRGQAELARREMVEAAKRPAHGGYPDPIKARDIARSRPHLKAVDAGGCAPPIIVTVDSDRATDRAYADAGIMPMADYVAKHGGED